MHVCLYRMCKDWLHNIISQISLFLLFLFRREEVYDDDDVCPMHHQ